MGNAWRAARRHDGGGPVRVGLPRRNLDAAVGEGARDAVAQDLADSVRGKNHDETARIDVGLHACKVLNAHDRVVFVTAEQMFLDGGLVARARDDGYRVVVVPDTVAQRLPRLKDIEGNAMFDLNEY